MPDFEHFDQAIADGMTRISDAQGGVVGYLGIRMGPISPGRLEASLEAKEEFHNPFGLLHGSVLASLVDHVLTCVLFPVLPKGTRAVTAEFKLNYLAPVRAGTVTAEATIVSLTKRAAVVRVDVTNDGRAVAAAQGTCVITDPKAEG